MAFPFCKETLFFVSVSDGPLAVTLTLPFVAFLFLLQRAPLAHG